MKPPVLYASGPRQSLDELGITVFGENAIEFREPITVDVAVLESCIVHARAAKLEDQFYTLASAIAYLSAHNQNTDKLVEMHDAVEAELSSPK